MSEAAKITPEGDEGSNRELNIDKFIASIMRDLRENKLDLPTLPQLAVKIGQAVSDKTINAKDLAKMISTDPALSARILHVANSPLFHSARKIENLQMAITLMGSDRVRNIVTSFLMKGLFRSKHKVLHERMLHIWNHSAHVAAVSYILAERESGINPDEAMLAGLLHDIGKLPILAKMSNVELNEHNLLVLEQVLEKLHQPLGKAILNAWHFAEPYVVVAAEHDNWRRDSALTDLADIVIVANLLSHIKNNDRPRVPMLEVPALSKLELDPESSIQIMKSAREDIKAIYDLFS